MSHSSHPCRNPPSCPQCGHLLHHHGDRRFRCPSCGKTRRLHRRRPGPKRKCRWTPPRLAEFFLQGKFTVRDAASFQNVSYGSAHAWIQRALTRYVERSAPGTHSSDDTRLVLIADALWLWCGRERWTVYLILARGVGKTEARLAMCCAFAGNESTAGWLEAFTALPAELRGLTVGVTSDGHLGLRHAVRELFPDRAHQWCQFHVLSEFLRRLGGKAAVKRDQATRSCWGTARLLLRLDTHELRHHCYLLLRQHIRMRGCPNRTRNAVRWFCRIAENATVGHDVLNANLPLTTGSAEATCKRLRRLLRQVRPTSSEQLQRALDIFACLHPTVRCNGEFPIIGLMRKYLRKS